MYYLSSGMGSEADWELWKEEDFVPYVQVKHLLMRLGFNVDLTNQIRSYRDSQYKGQAKHIKLSKEREGKDSKNIRTLTTHKQK